MKLHRILSIVLIPIAVLSCQDDWTFSADSRYTLDFSVDTLKMDTVFTGVASASAKFMVYNPNDVGLHFDAVMGGGSLSPFRINLDGEGGTQITDLEILAHDSLFCYVSVNIPETGMPDMFHAFDSVRFVLESGNVQFVRLNAYGQNAVRLRGRSIVNDTTLTAYLPHLIFDSLYVAEGATLTLAPGARLYFHDGAVLDVAGKVVAQGTADSMIVMLGDRLDQMQTTPPVAYDLLASQWGGIRIRGGSYGNVFRYCDIHSGEFGIKADSASADDIKFSMYSSIVHNVNGNCIEATGCKIDVVNSQITNAGESCVDLAGGKAEFTFCTIASLSLWKVGSQAVIISDHRGDAVVPFGSALFRNCIITGRHSNEFVTNLPDSIKNLDAYVVKNSLLMVSDTLDIHYHNVVFDRHGKKKGGAYNFRNNTLEGFRSVFALDSMSRARGIADDLSTVWTVDLAGVERPVSGADAGCYQYVPLE